MIPEVLFKISGNYWSQRLLERWVWLAQSLMGIGYATSASDSGEGKVIEGIRNQCGPLCVFDVGANKGQYLELLLKSFAGSEAAIHCFEPGTAAYMILQQKFSNKPQVKLNKLALSDVPGQAELFFDVPGGGLSSLTKRRLDHFSVAMDSSEQVQVSTLDDYCAATGVDHIHLLKMDAEGHELKILNGARRLFRQSAIDVVTFEFGGCNIDSRTFLQDFFYFFKEFDMEIGRITPSGFVRKIEKYSELWEQFRGTNFIATRRGQE